MRETILALAVVSLFSGQALATDYSDDVNKNDHRWFKFNYMYAVDELPGESNHDYVELEFGGRSGIFDMYGYVDLFNPFDSKNSDKYDQEKLFMKIAPRMSIDGLLKKDLSFGPVKELYVAGVYSAGGAGHSGNNISTNGGLIGLGADVEVPFMGTMGWSFLSQYDVDTREWNGYQISTGWFNPLINFDNGSFFAYQGYGDFTWGMNDSDPDNLSSTGFAMFNGFYWHYGKVSVGYGLKLFKNIYGLKDNGFAGKTTGAAHYFSAGYSF
ncbi:outer membrane protein OmpK [Vibrio artabrorum]|uniref:nucleoside-specific channel-forming Tsx family protein n=1 Tax=Vibrio artabrorum TaxID=446374 RepID=UPI00354C80C3